MAEVICSGGSLIKKHIPIRWLFGSEYFYNITFLLTLL